MAKIVSLPHIETLYKDLRERIFAVNTDLDNVQNSLQSIKIAVSNVEVPVEILNPPTTWNTINLDSFNITNLSLITTVCYGNGKFVIGGEGSGGSEDAVICYSTDGSTWTPCMYSPSSIYSICYGNGMFIAGGSYEPATSSLNYSYDGVEWLAVNSDNNPLSSSQIYTTYYSSRSGMFLAGGISGKICYSTNGIEWIEATQQNAFGTSDIKSICEGNNMFVACSSDGKIGYSVDGNTWESASQAVFTGYTNSICYGGGKFIVVGQGENGAGLAYSTNGVDWISITTQNVFTSPIYSICYSDGIFVAVGLGKIGYSIDGLEWYSASDNLPSPLNTNAILSIGYGNSTFVVGDQSGTIGYATTSLSSTVIPLDEYLEDTFANINSTISITDIDEICNDFSQ